MCQFCLEVLHLAKQHPTPAIKQQQATSRGLRAGEFLDNALGLKDPMMLLLITSQLVSWIGRGYGLIIFKHVQGTTMGCHQSVGQLDQQGVWIDHLQACAGINNGLQFSCHIASLCCYFQWKISAMAAASCLSDV
jgi:hypothetical protein